MGNIIQAVCRCGLESEAIYQGVGFSYPETGYEGEPAYCNGCGIVVGKDASKSFSKCPKCRKKMRFYKEELQVGDESEAFLYSSIDYQQVKGFWHCPRCKQETLQFESMGLWD